MSASIVLFKPADESVCLPIVFDGGTVWLFAAKLEGVL